MAPINSFYRNANAVSYATQLFSGTSASLGNTSSSGTAGSSRSAANQAGGYQNSGSADRALSRIIEILTLGLADGSDAASVDETVGYITQASGTSGDDTLDIKGRAVYNVAADAGNDTLTIKTDAAAGIDAGEGDDRINIAARFLNDVTGGAGDDNIQISAKLVLDVTGGGGADTIKISAATILGVDGGDGNDSLYLEGGRMQAAGGTGDDTVTFHQNGDGAVEYLFARGDGSDSVNSNAPLSIRFGPADGYSPDEMTITTSGNSLTIAFGDTKDKITVNFEDGALAGAKPAYAFSMDQGAYVLKIS